MAASTGNKGDVQDAIRALSVHIGKGLGIAPRPGFEDTALGRALATAQSLADAASTAAADLPNLARRNVQTISVRDVATVVRLP